MRQLPLAIVARPERSFENYLPGQNGLAVAHLQGMALHAGAPVFLWGDSGSGKTHLLQALAARIQDEGGRVSWFHPLQAQPWVFDETVSVLVLDECDRLDPVQQQAAFSLFVQATAHHIPVLAAGRLPPVDLPLREDLRTRLGWGHIFALQPLAEHEARGALRREADRRGLFLSDEVMDYLLTRFVRDLKHLMGLLDRLDEFALVHQRALTVPLLRQMLAEQSTA